MGVWVRRQVARLFWLFSRWRLVPEANPHHGPRLMLGAPHTSNFDFVLMLAIAWRAGLKVRWLGKQELFKGIAGPIMRGLGGIPVDRSRPEGIVGEVVALAKGDAEFALVVTPEGTRSGSSWRSGFYRIAYRAGLPVTMGFADGSTRSAGLGPTIELTGDVEADMSVIREFYADKTGVKPELRTEPRLQDEARLTAYLRESRNN
ncbi:1-acyl-sn-glycerol-3-phosphate acyltransferase [Leucobacter sp. UCMA 4100]|uniref:1-acyl-sn-glycerol-3-phosphate acyltransferase n=1 Tax=Leucobacter sp. UCMA 4100 TaxID=2810534 RepID=UPI0022EA1A63|nr:1-acyl-sn-glycerol-3-phosphate acyltransferase [Leucobacter sp. UCMA 4100]MDA3147278.1 1-acyl-sn-glycerol-3-phosphate acyltransferase [Leucobacter sp. UCMA 4100]